MKKRKISDAVVRRLPRYYRYLDDLHSKGIVRISSSLLGERMGITASQIRQDLSCFGEFGQQGYGYNVKKLRYEIREILGLNSRNTAVLVGCGNMGQALLKNFDFEACGFYMVAAFDQDPDKIATQVGPVRVLDVGVLRRFVEAEKPCMAVLTVPRDAAPGMAKLLGEIGIQAIWNFTGCKLEAPDVLVEDVSFSSSLLTLSYRLNQKKEERELSSESSPNGSHGIG
jgi:redox-sensing transcriptional repressor